MKRIIIFFVLFFAVMYMLFMDKRGDTLDDTIKEQVAIENPLISKVLKVAINYKGVPYKFGGTTNKGMDCSGLVFTSFKAIDMALARSSKNMYYEGVEVDLKDVKRGDLLFFDTNKFESQVNHVGLVTSVNDFEVNFIHSVDTKGVIITSINESHWKKAFIKAKRILK